MNVCNDDPAIGQSIVNFSLTIIIQFCVVYYSCDYLKTDLMLFSSRAACTACLLR